MAVAQNWTKTKANRGFAGIKSPLDPINADNNPEGGGGPGASPDAGPPGIVGFDPGIMGLGIGSTLGMAPGFGGLAGSIAGVGLGAMSGGNLSTTGNLGVPGIPSGTSVASHNVPDNVVDAVMSALGMTAAPSFTAAVPGLNSGHVGEPSPDDAVDITEAAGNVPTNAGWTDTTGLTSNEGMTDNGNQGGTPGGVAGGGVADGGGTAAGGSASGAGGGGAGGVGTGVGETLHNGGYVGGDGTGQDVMARLQPGEFVVPQGGFAEGLREANPTLTKYGHLLDKSPIRDYISPSAAAKGELPGNISPQQVMLMDVLSRMYGQSHPMEGAQIDARGMTDEPSPGSDTEEEFARTAPSSGQKKTPPGKPEGGRDGSMQGMQKLHKMMLEFS